MYLPNTLADVPINIHTMAHNTPRIEKHRSPHLDPPFTVLSEEGSLVFMAFILTLPKLDIRSKALFTRVPSEAEAGVVGIDSRKPHRAEENHEFLPLLSSLPL